MIAEFKNQTKKKFWAHLKGIYCIADRCLILILCETILHVSAFTSNYIYVANVIFFPYISCRWFPSIYIMHEHNSEPGFTENKLKPTATSTVVHVYDLKFISLCIFRCQELLYMT